MENLTFSQCVRNELVERIAKKNNFKKAQLLGMLCFSDICSSQEILLTTEHDGTITVFSELLQNIFGICPELSVITKRFSTRYVASVRESGDILDIFAELFVNENLDFPDMDMFTSEELAFFLCGVYLVCGTVSDPNKNYRLEFTMNHEAHAYRLCELISKVSEPAAITMRKNQYVVYVKSSESIEDLLIFMGAKLSAMELMNIKIYKDIRNQTNRRLNCETANIGKTVTAAMSQMEDIQLIVEKGGWESFPETLCEIAKLRMDNPDMSLSELGKSLSAPLSRSGVNHRFEKIHELANTYR